MHTSIKVLDCTLRDGGYINDWQFTDECITNAISKLGKAGIDIIEMGFLDEHYDNYSSDCTVFPDIKSAEIKLLNSELSTASKYVLMIMHGKYNPENLPEVTDQKISGIRYCFKKEYMDEALKNCEIIRRKGYDVYIQPASITDYSDIEIIRLVEMANKLDIASFYIVDTYGLMRRDEVVRFFYIINNNLKPETPIGFHSHNNLQLSFSNAQALTEINQKRELYIDSSVFGMGRGAGNLCTELLTQYINENVENKYDLIPILEIMDECIMPIYAQHPWGYSAPYYIAAINNCHPNYATYLMERQSLCVRDINTIIKSIPTEKRHIYDKEFISRLYTEYQQNTIDDTDAVLEIAELCRGRNILILAPGKSLVTMQDEITEYIKKNDPVIFAVNHIPEDYQFDRVFISNLKRFNGIDDAIDQIKTRIICTSNIAASDNVCSVNYSSYLNEDDNISDNSGLMIINILRKAGVNAVALAGYDGFRYSAANNYYDDKMINNVQFEKQEQLNRSIIAYFAKLRKNMDITFITPTIYDGGDQYK